MGKNNVKLQAEIERLRLALLQIRNHPGADDEATTHMKSIAQRALEGGVS